MDGSGAAVEFDPVSGVEPVGEVGDGDDGGDAHFAGDDGGMGEEAAPFDE